MHGSQLQLVKGQPISQLSFMVPRRTRSKIRNGTQHYQNKQQLLKTSARRNRNIMLHEFLQYARRPLIDERGLGRWCSWVFYSNPSHVTRIVVAYRPGKAKTKGLKTVYQHTSGTCKKKTYKGHQYKCLTRT